MIVFAVVTALIGVLAALRIAGPLARGAGSPLMRLSAFGAAVVVAVGALGIYAIGGRPDAPGRPWSEVVAELELAGPENLGPEARIALLRERVRREPEDADALLALGRTLAGAGRELESVALIERAARVRPDARSFADLGQALVALNEGQVTPEARRAFSEALEQDPTWPEAAFYMGLAAYQDDERGRAADIWAEAIAARPEGDQYRELIARQAADLLSRPQAGPLDEDGADAASAPINQPGGVEAMVRGMADRLEARLSEPDAEAEFSDWLVLARTRALLEEDAAAAIALGRARSLLEPDDPRLEIADALAQRLGMQEGET
jgi:cytochrome c-type biogenesis protein CcmH